MTTQAQAIQIAKELRELVDLTAWQYDIVGQAADALESIAAIDAAAVQEKAQWVPITESEDTLADAVERAQDPANPDPFHLKRASPAGQSLESMKADPVAIVALALSGALPEKQTADILSAAFAKEPAQPLTPARVPVAWRYKAVRIVDGVRVPIKQMCPEGHEWEITQNPPHDWSHLSYPLNYPAISDYEALCVMPTEDKPC